VVHTERGFDRIVNFSDATVAIAMTLLVLPLVDLGGDTGENQTLWELLTNSSNAIFAFVLSFLVICSMWTNHHRIMEFFADYDSRILGLHLVWLLTMVSIPFTTEVLANPEYYQHGATALYVAVLLVNSVSLHLLALHGRQHRELLHDRPEVTEWLAGAFTWRTALLLAAILVVVIIFPGLGAWPMLLLFVDGLVESRTTQRRKLRGRSTGD
jgi:uncharacterized membrane protein